MFAKRRKRLLSALLPALFSLAFVACGDEEAQRETSPEPSEDAAFACGAQDVPGDVISSFEVELLSRDQAKATFVLSRDVEVGVLTSRAEAGRHELGSPRLRLVGRVPFGPQRSTVVNEQVFDLPKENGQPLEAGFYEMTLRAFEAGKLNVGDPIETQSACVTIE